MWISEDPWPPMIIVGLIGLGLLMVGVSTQRPKYLIVGGVCGVVCIAIWFIEQRIITEGERIEANLHGLADAFHRNDEGRVLSYFSTQAEFYRNMAKAGLALVDLSDDYRITDFSVDLRAEETLAQSLFRLNATVSLAGQGGIGYQPTRWSVDWRKEAGEWKIVEVRRLAVVGEGEMAPFAGTR